MLRADLVRPTKNSNEQFGFNSQRGEIMFVGMWMVKDLLTIGPDESVGNIATLMAQHRIRRLPVVDKVHDSNKLLGIVSYSDVLHAFPADLNPFSSVANDEFSQRMNGTSDLTAADIMHDNPLTVLPQDPIEKAAKLMRDKKIGALPVISQDHLVGLITESDLFRAFASIFDTHEPGVRITFDISSGEDVFPIVAELIKKHQLKLHTLVSLPHHSRALCVISAFGRHTDKLVDDLWKSKHAVVNVIALTP
jgi:acetoin utilization protein AcuB